MPSRNLSTNSISWTSVPSKLPKIASGFFQQVTNMNWLDDKHIFNWGRGEESNDLSDDVYYLLDRVYTGISGRSRSGSVSESDSRSASRNRSRTNSISSEVFKVEGMTSLPTNPAESVDRLTSRRIFRIDDVDEDDEEDDEGQVHQLAVVEAKKNV